MPIEGSLQYHNLYYIHKDNCGSVQQDWFYSNQHKRQTDTEDIRFHAAIGAGGKLTGKYLNSIRNITQQAVTFISAENELIN